MASSEPSSQLFTNRLYDKFKFFALVALPGFGALYFGLAQIWGLPKAEEIVGSIAVIDTFLGLMLNQQNKKYYANENNFDGEARVIPEDGGNKVVLSFNDHPEDIVDDLGKHSLELKIERRGEVG